MRQPTRDVGNACIYSTLALIDQGLMFVCKYIMSLFYFSTCTYCVYTGFHLVTFLFALILLRRRDSFPLACLMG